MFLTDWTFRSTSTAVSQKFLIQRLFLKASPSHYFILLQIWWKQANSWLVLHTFLGPAYINTALLWDFHQVESNINQSQLKRCFNIILGFKSPEARETSFQALIISGAALLISWPCFLPLLVGLLAVVVEHVTAAAAVVYGMPAVLVTVGDSEFAEVQWK